MRYAEVAVNSPAARRQTFSYAVPPDTDIRIGQAVWVPFGARTLQGIVMALPPLPAVAEVKPISDVIDDRPLLSPERAALAQWLSDYYLAPVFTAVALMLPPGFERKSLTFISAASDLAGRDTAGLSDGERQLLKLIPETGAVPLTALEAELGIMKARRRVAGLVDRGFLEKSFAPEAPRLKAKQLPYLSPDAAASDYLAEHRQRAPRQTALLEYLLSKPGAVPQAEALAESGGTAAALSALVRRGLVKREMLTVRRDPIAGITSPPEPPPEPNAAQLSALRHIKDSLHRGPNAGAAVFLLHGITASGKTEVYLRALEEARKTGRRGIVLVPEISLTPQTIARFASRFPGRVAVLHSRLSAGEQYDEWHRIRAGESDVVIGSRSAIFAPQPDLGLIIIDEEHEWSYKQQDKAPPYHSREVARKLADLCGATLILGSATPDVETYHRTQSGGDHLLSLPERVVPRAASPLPEVTVIDQRDELKNGNQSIFSRALKQGINEALARREQVILFLNRRGGASYVQCRECGFVFRCRRCDVSLTQHRDTAQLVCHQCQYRQPLPAGCPRCQGRRLDFRGTGTQKLEETTRAAFPSARILRWDSDTTTNKDAHRQISARFRSHQADILIGTQMIAKGLDLPLVTLVGVINADSGLYLPDFRAGERTFQLLCQVSGRAGRGTHPGRVIIQTFSPEHYAVRTAAAQDYELFYEKEIAYRRLLHNPPFSGLTRLIFSHSNSDFCRQEAMRIKRVLHGEISARGSGAITVIGPAPAFIARLRGRYRWQLILRGERPQELLDKIDLPRGWTVNIDPLGLA